MKGIISIEPSSGQFSLIFPFEQSAIAENSYTYDSNKHIYYFLASDNSGKQRKNACDNYLGDFRITAVDTLHHSLILNKTLTDQTVGQIAPLFTLGNQIFG